MNPLIIWLQSGGQHLLIDIAVKASVLSVLGFVAVVALKRASAATRHLVWLGALVAMLLLPAFTVLLPSLNVPWAPQWKVSSSPLISEVAPATSIPSGAVSEGEILFQEVPAMEGISAPVEVMPRMSSAHPPQGAWPVSAMLLGFWLVGVVLALVPVGVGGMGLKVLRKKSKDVTDPAILKLVDEARRHLRIGRSIVVRRASLTTMPVTWGTWNPVLLLPETFFEWTSQRQRIVIFHELAHIKRLDWLAQLVAQVASAVYWFNPLVWVAARRMRIERELASDDLVIQAGSRPTDYAGELLTIASNFGEGRLLYRSAGVPMARRSTLDGRLISILDRERNRSAASLRDVLTVAACFAVVAIPLAALQARPLPSPVETRAADSARSVVDSPISDRQRIAMEAGQIARTGAHLNRDMVATLEEKLGKNSGDLETRTKLVGYYDSQRYADKSAPSAHARHVLWLIEHHPENLLISTPYTRIDPIITPDEYHQGKELFLKHLTNRPDDLNLLANAATFFTFHDQTLCIELLHKAAGIDPANPYWHERLGHQYGLMGNSALSLDKQREYTRKSFDAFQRAYETGSDLKRNELLPYMAKRAFAAGAIDKAEQYARIALQQGNGSGDSHFAGHTILGRIALTKDDVESAKDHLLQSARTEGSPVLGSFGPNMSLAKDLIERGETETVLAFFEACGKFWKSDKLETWAANVREGRMPDFGANLNY